MLTDNNGNRIGNLGDPKFDKDAVNLVTLKRFTSTIPTNFLATSGGTITGTTKFEQSITANTASFNTIQLIPQTVLPTPSNGLIFFSGNSLYVFTGNTTSSAKKL